MATRKYKKSIRSKKNYKGGSDFGPISHSVINPNLTYELNNFENDPSRQIQNARNLVGGKKSRKNRKNKSRKNNSKKGGMYFFSSKLYNEDRPLII